MAVKFHRPGLVPSSCSNPWMSVGTLISCRRVLQLDYISNCCGNSRTQLFVTYDDKNYFLQRKLFGNKKMSSRRTTQSFLAANGFSSLENPVEDLVRHFIGGSLLQYPQLSAISSYQLYVEVVCEELDWIPFYPARKDSQPAEQSHGHKSRPQGPPNYDALPQILNVCSYWLQSFIKYSKWPENPSNVKAAKFLSKGHNKLIQCQEELGISSLAVTEASFIDMTSSSTDGESSSFDKALESVDGALVRLESLLQQLHASSSSSGKEQIKAACSDLEKIRKLKKEAEFLEASFRAKAASLQEGGGDSDSQEYSEEQSQYLRGKDPKNSINSVDQGTRDSGFWGFFVRTPKGKPGPESLTDKYFEKSRENVDNVDSNPNEWFWSGQVPSAVTSFVNCFEGDQRFVSATSVYVKSNSTAASNEIEVSLLMLVLNCIAAVTKLGPTKLSCPPFFSVIPDTTGRLMDKFVGFVPLPQTYHSMKTLGLRREFLLHFGPRAAACRVKSDCDTDEVVFWVDLIQNQLLRAIDREKIWSRLITSESIEVLDRDLAIFGFFIALGKSTQSFLTAAMELLRRSVVGDELTEKEKKALRRTMTDLASVVPIGVLMLLPVTAVGHAAMLAAIQRYVPGLIPSTYGAERLNLLRQLEKVKQMQTNETEPEEGIDEPES